MGKLQLCWTGEFEDLKEFVSENIELNAVWKSPGGDKKTFSDGHTTISWRKSKNVLQIEGKDENTIKAKLCSVLCGFVAASAGSGNSSSTLSELSTDVEGIKLDATISEKDIQSNRLAIKNVEDSVNQVSENYREIYNKLDNCMKEIYLLHNNKHTAQSVQTLEYSNLVDKDPFQQEIHCYDTATNTKELSHLTANDLTNTTNVSKIYNEIENLKESQSINSELVQTLSNTISFLTETTSSLKVSIEKNCSKDTRKQDDYVNSTNYENPFVLTKLSITDESNTEECFSLSNENAIVSSQTENSSLNLDLPIKDLIHAHSQEENTTSSSAVIMRNPTNWLNYLPFCEVPLPKHEKLSNFQSDKINPQLSDCCPLSTPPSEKIDVKKRGANKGKLSFPSRKNKTCTKKSERHHSDRSPFHRRPTNHAPVMYHPNSLPPYQIHQLRKLHIPSYQPHRLNISPPYLPPCQKELPPYYPSPPMRSREWLDYLDIVHQVTRIL